MTDRLDHLVTRLAGTATDRALDGFSAEILRGISQQRMQTRTAFALAPVGAAAIAVALALGVTVGSVTARAAHPSGTNGFTVVAELAPSTLLEGAQ